MELVNEWLSTRSFRKIDTLFRTDSTYEKEIMAAHPLTGNDICKAEMEYYGNFGNNLGQIHLIALVGIIGICFKPDVW